MRNQKTINADRCHEQLFRAMQPKLSAREGMCYEEWKESVRLKFFELVGMENVKKNACPLNVQIEWTEDKETYTLIRFTFESEVEEIVPCYLCVPKTGKKKYPVAIVLQGHTTGFHNSIGEIKFEQDKADYPNDAFALQAVERGFIALAIEQRGMGERKSTTPNRHMHEQCRYASLVALEMGRTLLAERMWDVSKAIDALAHFEQCDLDKILITGHSGGGTMTYYASCFDERIKLSVPSCSLCPYKESILEILHCNCNYIPGIYQWLDMQDMSCLIAPRRLVAVTGAKDDIFPIHGVRRGFETVRKIYEENGVAENCRLIETTEAHKWIPSIVWGVIDEECKKMGWF